jgi:hypothetical protein
MQELERAFEAGQSTCQLLIAGHLYDIDFPQMVQYRVNNRNMARRIKRDAASASAEKRGIAGIRLGADRMETENVATGATPVVNNRRRRHEATSQSPAQPNAIPPPPSSGSGDSVLDPANVQMANAQSDDDDENEEGDDEGVDSDPDLEDLEEDDEMDLGEVSLLVMHLISVTCRC